MAHHRQPGDLKLLREALKKIFIFSDIVQKGGRGQNQITIFGALEILTSLEGMGYLESPPFGLEMSLFLQGSRGLKRTTLSLCRFISIGLGGVGVKAILDNVTKYEGFFKASLIKVIGKGQGKVR